ncbi:hypothetical protein H6504_04190 [Candidatus Woesearchaeota archaeon]|nr:hypothetical protein [Candidatus Woesearchaeota archaeon]
MLLEVIDKGDIAYQYSTSNYIRSRTNVCAWLMRDEYGNLFRLDIPVNEDSLLTRLYELDSAGHIQHRLPIRDVEAIT